MQHFVLQSTSAWCILEAPVENVSCASDDTSLVGADLRDADLRHVDLRGKVLFQADLRGANLYNTGISLRCQTFDGVTLDNDQVAQLLLMLQTADIDPKAQVGMRDLVKRLVGEAKYKALFKWLKLV
jgi:hypothetical protein